MFAVETLIFINHNLHLYGSKKEGSKEGSKEDCSEEEEEEGINNRSSTKQELPMWEFLFSSILQNLLACIVGFVANCYAVLRVRHNNIASLPPRG